MLPNTAHYSAPPFKVLEPDPSPRILMTRHPVLQPSLVSQPLWIYPTCSSPIPNLGDFHSGHSTLQLHQDDNPCTKEATPRGFSKENSIAQELRPATDKWELMKLKSVCIAKETANRVIGKPTEPEGSFSSCVSNRINTQNTQEPKKQRAKKIKRPNFF